MRTPLMACSLPGAVALCLTLGPLPAGAQHRSGPCPRPKVVVVREAAPPAPTVCLFDELGRVKAAIAERSPHSPLPSVVIFNDAAPYHSLTAGNHHSLPTVPLDPGRAPSSFDDLPPTVRARVAELLGSPLTTASAPASAPEPITTAGIETPSDQAILARYEYDAFGRVRSKIGEEGLRHYVYEGDSNRVLAEYDQQGNLAATYTWAGERLHSITRPALGTVYPAVDGLGSIGALVDGQGAIAARYSYDAWGNFRLREEAVSPLNSYGFTGHRWEPNLGLYQANARFYDPEVGRFTTQDSYLGEIADPASLHRYFYGNASPTRYVDPSGHQSIGAEFCRAFRCSDNTRRQVDPLYAAEKTLDEAVNTVGGAAVIVGAQLIEDTVGNPGHITSEARARRNAALPQPKNTVEALLASGGYLAVIASPAGARALRETPVEVGPFLARRPGATAAQAGSAALRGVPDGVVAESNTQVAPSTRLRITGADARGAVTGASGEAARASNVLTREQIISHVEGSGSAAPRGDPEP
jgi:RHS repeat-associated protein